MTSRTYRHAVLSLTIVCCLNTSWISLARADNALPPKIIAATVDSTLTTLTVKGGNFGTAPILSLGAYGNLQLISRADTLITARLPAGVLPGSYLLTLLANNKTVEFSVTVAAVGSAGPAGPVSPVGPGNPS